MTAGVTHHSIYVLYCELLATSLYDHLQGKQSKPQDVLVNLLEHVSDNIDVM